MATLVHSLLIRAFKITLFLCLFVLSMRFIHTYPLPMPPEHQHQLFVISRKLNIRDPEDLYLSTLAIVNLVAATIEYRLIMKLWRKIQGKWRHTAESR
jgi:hypothetical protein